MTLFGKKIQEIKKDFSSTQFRDKKDKTTTRARSFQDNLVPEISALLTNDNSVYNNFENGVKDALKSLMNNKNLNVALNNFDYSILFTPNH